VLRQKQDGVTGFDRRCERQGSSPQRVALQSLVRELPLVDARPTLNDFIATKSQSATSHDGSQTIQTKFRLQSSRRWSTWPDKSPRTTHWKPKRCTPAHSETRRRRRTRITQRDGSSGKPMGTYFDWERPSTWPQSLFFCSTSSRAPIQLASHPNKTTTTTTCR
jgi:hypothetical protein